MKIWQLFIRSLKKYEYLANFDSETGKSMKIWQILTKRWKKYENLVKFGILELAPPLKMLEFWKVEGPEFWN